MGHMAKVSFNPRERGFKPQNDMHDSTPYVVAIKLQLTICYVPCVEPEFRSLAQYGLTL